MDDVRKFQSKDKDGVKELILSILTKEYPFDRSAYADSDINDIEGVYGGKRSVFYVIEEDSKIVGTVGVKNDTEETALLRRIFVDAGYRRKGYGSKLVEKALEFCRKNDYKEVVFRATDRMRDAMKLCEKFGFQEMERLPISGFYIHKFLLKL